MTEAPTSAQFQVSLSAYQTFQECEQKYFYRWVRRLKPKEQFIAPQLGIILHDYLQNFYTALKEGKAPSDAHLVAQLETSSKYVPEIRSYANTAFIGGAEQLAKELNELPALAGRISDRYFEVRGRYDADQYKVIFVESPLNLSITDSIRSVGFADLCTQDQGTGRVNLWEHKTTQNIPPDSVRLRDFQTMLYAVKVRWQLDIVIDSVIWNYMRTKEPVVPEQLKSGGLTRRKDIDTTWEVYASSVESIGGNPDAPEFDEMRERLLGRETSIFFPRYEQVIVVQEDMLMNDYISVAERMRRARYDWTKGMSTPVRTISRSCDYCEFSRVCQAALTGGDEEDVISMRFTEGKNAVS